MISAKTVAENIFKILISVKRDLKVESYCEDIGLRILFIINLMNYLTNMKKRF